MTVKRITDPKVHIFESTGEAYDATQTEDHIKDGDVLVIPSEGVIGFLYKAWPVAVIYEDRGAFHTLDPGQDIACVGAQAEKRMTVTICPPGKEPYKHEEVFPADPGTDYTASVRLARDTATSDADITGNEHWRDA